MGDTLSEVMLKGGPVALVIAVALSLRYLASAYLTWRQGRDAHPDASPSPMADAATTNALLLDSLRSEREENAAKDVTIAHLQQECIALRTELFEQRRQFEQEIRELQRTVQEATLQLDDLQRRIAIPNSDQV